MRPRAWLLAGFCVLLAASVAAEPAGSAGGSVGSAAPAEDFDEDDEFFQDGPDPAAGKPRVEEAKEPPPAEAEADEVEEAAPEEEDDDEKWQPTREKLPSRAKKQKKRVQGPYYAEFGMLALLFVYGLNFLRGRSANMARAEAWSEITLPLLEKEFALVGMKPGMRTLTKTSHSEFKCYASGRRYCLSALFTMQLCKRQDLLHLIYGLFYKSTDLLTIDIEMENLPPYVFAVCRRNQHNALKRDHADLRHYTSRVRDPGTQGGKGGGGGAAPLDEALCVCTDCAELVFHFLTPEVVNAIKSAPATPSRLPRLSNPLERG